MAQKAQQVIALTVVAVLVYISNFIWSYVETMMTETEEGKLVTCPRLLKSCSLKDERPILRVSHESCQYQKLLLCFLPTCSTVKCFGENL
jgi:hypothetical protein